MTGVRDSSKMPTVPLEPLSVQVRGSTVAPHAPTQPSTLNLPDGARHDISRGGSPYTNRVSDATGRAAGASIPKDGPPSTTSTTPLLDKKITPKQTVSLSFLTKLYNALASIFNWPKIKAWDAGPALKSMLNPTSSPWSGARQSISASTDANTVFSSRFDQDCDRARMQIGGRAFNYDDVQTQLKRGSSRDVSKAEVGQHYSSELHTFLEQSLLQAQGKLPADATDTHLLRYQVQDLATQRLFVMDDAIFSSMAGAYMEQGRYPADNVIKSNDLEAVKALGVPDDLFTPRGFNPGLQYSITRDGNTVKITGIKKCVVQDVRNEGKPIGFDALRVEMTIDLTKLDSTKLLTEQPAGCITSTYSQLGFTKSWDDVHF